MPEITRLNSQDAGFEAVEYHNFFSGVAAIRSLFKPDVGQAIITSFVIAIPAAALSLALALGLFSILFGVRRLEANEHHRGMVLAVAFESLVKLVALLSVGLFALFGVFGGAGGGGDQTVIDAEDLVAGA
mgnify:CR=1 FL=1